MGIVDRLETRASLEDPNTPLASGVTVMSLFGGVPTYTGRRVDAGTALTSSAVYAAVNIIAGTVGSLPLKVYRRLDRGKQEARDHPLWPLLHDAPNRDMTAVNYREACQGHLLLRGNAYSKIELDRTGTVQQLYALHPVWVEMGKSASDRVYKVQYPDGKRETLTREQVLHISGLGGGDGVGYGVVTLARQSIALGLSQEEYAARFFGNSSRPQGILTTAESLSPEARANLRDSWTAAYGGLENSNKVAVLDEDLKWQSIGLTNEDSQFLQSRQFSVREIARWFNIPPHKIRDLEDATFSNIEAQNVEFVVDTLLPWLRRWEQAITQQLISDADRAAGVFVEFVVDGLLRGDTAARSEYYRTLFALGAITPNEIRAKENFDMPVEGGDVPFVQLNLVPLDQAQETLLEDDGSAVPPAEADDEEEASSVGRGPQHGAEMRAAPSPSRRLALRAAFLPLLRDAAQRLVGREVNYLRRLINRYLRSGDPTVFLRAMSDYYRDEFVEVVREIMGAVMRAYATQVRDAAFAEVPDKPADAAVGDEWTDAYIDTFGRRYAAESSRQLSRVASVPVDDTDVDAPSVEDNLEARLARWSDGEDGVPRAKIVADREATQLLNAMTKTAFAAAGVATLVWVTAGENCDLCNELDGKVVSIDMPFLSAGDTVNTASNSITPSGSIGHPPLHDGCDCMIVPGA